MIDVKYQGFWAIGLSKILGHNWTQGLEGESKDSHLHFLEHF
jgi:hypothetical protein